MRSWLAPEYRLCVLVGKVRGDSPDDFERDTMIVALGWKKVRRHIAEANHADNDNINVTVGSHYSCRERTEDERQCEDRQIGLGFIQLVPQTRQFEHDLEQLSEDPV